MRSEVKKTVRKLVCGILGCKKVSFRKALRKIGLESLSFAELIVQTEDKFGIELAGDRISYFRNLNEFAIYVESKLI